MVSSRVPSGAWRFTVQPPNIATRIAPVSSTAMPLGLPVCASPCTSSRARPGVGMTIEYTMNFSAFLLKMWWWIIPPIRARGSAS